MFVFVLMLPDDFTEIDQFLEPHSSLHIYNPSCCTSSLLSRLYTQWVKPHIADHRLVSYLIFYFDFIEFVIKTNA